MTGQYFFIARDDGRFTIADEQNPLGNVSSRELAIKVVKALNALDERKRKFTVLNRIKEWRLRRGKTQAELAELIAVSQATAAKYEHGRQGIDLVTLEKIANALQVDPALLITNREE